MGDINVSNKRVRLRAVYKGVETKKGFKGFWEMKYIMHDLVDVETGGTIKSTYKMNDVACIKGKKFKIGDILEFTATLEVSLSNGKVKVLRPSNVILVGHIDD